MAPIIRAHLDRFVDDRPDAWLFTGERTRGLVNPQSVRNAFYRARKHAPRLEACGFRLYDLRHTALTSIGHKTNSVVEVMRAGGHTQVKTAMHYQHSTEEGRREIAEKIQDEWDPAHTPASAARDSGHGTTGRGPDTDTGAGDGTTIDPVALADMLTGMDAGMRAAMLDGVDAGTVSRVLAAMPPGPRLETITALHRKEEQ